MQDSAPKTIFTWMTNKMTLYDRYLFDKIISLRVNLESHQKKGTALSLKMQRTKPVRFTFRVQSTRFDEKSSTYTSNADTQ